ncbi:hypothetical protein [Duncaniella freteri]|uniref:Uncharacterized protein n=1 Tax=Duncaniella freteri TaxID=2530391 RepID=A0A4Z0V3V5_9BACT|nr:hypothetical protein [Duncaniella freteri]QCD39700.1 hypothetical protein E7745_09250 [Duncaniella sp. C9]ROT10426.1 hypothetical protein EEL42_03445 [Muribaculaceae bacterium Isolate-100 (HZI)]RXE66288.1 hypothetical protein ED388_04710 [Muribaculaceae bacterium Isolate-007 (NCI)]TGG36588.1 hypothetical protein EZ315_12165 [Duncaniella freteri]
MKKKYRIRRTCKWVHSHNRHLYCPTYSVQVRTWPGLWIDVKQFKDEEDPDFARREAEELLDKLNEK